MKITTITGSELAELARILRDELDGGFERGLHTLRVAMHGDGQAVMFKVNEGAWTRSYGARQPANP